MTYRGVVKNGIVILEDGSGLHNGTVVDVQRAARAPAKSRTSQRSPAASPAGRSTKKTKLRKGKARKPAGDPFLEAFGMWKDRPEWKGKSSVEIAAELRRKAMGRYGV